MSEGIERFVIHVPDDVLADLRQRLNRTRWPEQVGRDWLYGTPMSYLQDLCSYWSGEFDWRAQEARLNSFDHFVTEVEGQQLHFIHQLSPEANARPLLLSHGWPGSVCEFIKIIGPLTNPRAYGGDPNDAFHVVAPSIPGYGFSQAPTEPGVDARAVARRFAILMDKLGYPRYFAQGGDWGAAISTWIAVDDAPHPVAIHLNLVFAAKPKGDDAMAGVSEEEAKRYQSRLDYMAEETGYQSIQSTKPQTLGYGLNDSPAGLAAWISEKFHGWTHHSGDHHQAVTRDELLTNITIYWVTNTITSSTRLYYENRHVANRYPQRIETPTAVAIFPGELSQPPRKWVERQYNLVHWSDMPRGGHFAALEAPELLVADIRAAFGQFR